MQRILPTSLMALLALATVQTAASQTLSRSSLLSLGLLQVLHLANAASPQIRTSYETSNNGTNFVWIIQDTYDGHNFFECVP